jgi:hypothetical protein
MSRTLDIEKIDAALERAANRATNGTREERSGRFRTTDTSRTRSSMMTSVRYDHDQRELDITFTDGKTYRYLNVPRDIYVNLIDAESMGDYFNDAVRDAFTFVEVKRRRQRQGSSNW